MIPTLENRAREFYASHHVPMPKFDNNYAKAQSMYQDWCALPHDADKRGAAERGLADKWRNDRTYTKTFVIRHSPRYFVVAYTGRYTIGLTMNPSEAKTFHKEKLAHAYIRKYASMFSGLTGGATVEEIKNPA